jgi:hypothetical protein
MELKGLVTRARLVPFADGVEGISDKGDARDGRYQTAG